MHDVKAVAMAKGRADVTRGCHVLARLVATVVGFPKTLEDAQVSVRFEAKDGAETWTRTFGQYTFSSRQFAGRHRSDGLLCERFGALTFAMALVQEDQRLSLVVRRWSLFGLPLPLWLCPRSESHESVEDGRFCFFVRISHPLGGLIIEYKGWLIPDQQSTITSDPVA